MTLNTGLPAPSRTAGQFTATPPCDTMTDLAGDFVRDMCSFAETRGLPIDRNRLLEETANFVQRVWGISDRSAQIVAGKAIGRHESWGSAVSFDMSHSTSHTIFLNDARTGRVHAVTAVELARLLAGHNGQLS